MSGQYDDIISMRHIEPKNKARMSVEQRATQFAPFAALSGLGEEMSEAARQTEKKRMPVGESLRELNEKLCYIRENSANGLRVEFVYFVTDKRKDGGIYIKASGTVKYIDEASRKIFFRDNEPVCIDDLAEICTDFF